MKNTKGLTAMVDAMIFIVIMGILVVAMFSIQNNEEYVMNEASEVSDQLFSAKMRISDVMDAEDSLIVPLTDLLAASIVTGESSVSEYVVSVLDSLTERPGAYRLNMSYRDVTVTLGTGDGPPISGCERSLTVTYGGTLVTELFLY
jgi:hypothetical protein